MYGTGTRDGSSSTSSAVSKMLMVTIEALDGFERMLIAVVPQADAGASTPGHADVAAELLAALRLHDVIHADSSNQPSDGFDALRRVQHNAAELGTTISRLLVEVCTSQIGAAVDLPDIVARAQRAMDSFTADPAAPATAGSGPVAWEQEAAVLTDVPTAHVPTGCSDPWTPDDGQL